MKQVNDDDLIVISGGGSIEHVLPKPGGDAVDIRGRVGSVTPGGQPGPEADGSSGGGLDDLIKK